MAIDSALKRFSATGLLLPFRGGCLPGTAGIVAAERQVAAWVYSGIAAGEAVLISIIDPTITSITAIRSLISATQKRIFTSKTPIREVKSL